MVRIPGFHCRGPGSIPGQGIEIPQAARHGKKKKLLKNMMVSGLLAQLVEKYDGRVNIIYCIIINYNRLI